MATRFCPNCGRPALSSATFCAGCGAALGTAPGRSAGFVPAGGGSPNAAPLPYSSYPGSTDRLTPSTRADDRSALGHVVTAAVVLLVGSILGLITVGLVESDQLVGVSTGGSGVVLSETALYTIGIAAVVGLVLELFALLYFRRAFQTLAVEDAEFRTPSSLTAVLLISVALIGAILLGLIGELLQAAACAGAGNPLTASCLNLGALVGLLIGLAIVAIVALVGYIGLMLGIWRLGNRYQSGLFKAGAILLIIPYVNVVGVILILAAASTARKQLSGGSFRYAFGGA